MPPAAPLGDSGFVRRRPDEDPALTTRATFHGSGAVAFSTKGEYGVRLMVQLGRRYGTGPASLAGPLQPMICVTDDPAHIACDRSARCTVNVLWVKVRDAISGTLDAMTLADLVPARHIDLEPNPTLTGAHS